MFFHRVVCCLFVEEDRENVAEEKKIMPKLFCSIYVVHTGSFLFKNAFFYIQRNNCQVDSIITDDKYKYGLKIACIMLVNIYSGKNETFSAWFYCCMRFSKINVFFFAVWFFALKFQILSFAIMFSWPHFIL